MHHMIVSYLSIWSINITLHYITFNQQDQLTFETILIPIIIMYNKLQAYMLL